MEAWVLLGVYKTFHTTGLGSSSYKLTIYSLSPPTYLSQLLTRFLPSRLLSWFPERLGNTMGEKNSVSE